jgi:hypothetical protein
VAWAGDQVGRALMHQHVLNHAAGERDAASTSHFEASSDAPRGWTWWERESLRITGRITARVLRGCFATIRCPFARIRVPVQPRSRQHGACLHFLRRSMIVAPRGRAFPEREFLRITGRLSANEDFGGDSQRLAAHSHVFAFQDSPRSRHDDASAPTSYFASPGWRRFASLLTTRATCALGPKFRRRPNGVRVTRR